MCTVEAVGEIFQIEQIEANCLKFWQLRVYRSKIWKNHTATIDLSPLLHCHVLTQLIYCLHQRFWLIKRGGSRRQPPAGFRHQRAGIWDSTVHICEWTKRRCGAGQDADDHLLIQVLRTLQRNTSTCIRCTSLFCTEACCDGTVSMLLFGCGSYLFYLSWRVQNFPWWILSIKFSCMTGLCLHTRAMDCSSMRFLIELLVSLHSTQIASYMER